LKLTITVDDASSSNTEPLTENSIGNLVFAGIKTISIDLLAYRCLYKQRLNT